MGILPLLLAFTLTTQEAQTWQDGLTPTDVLTAGRITAAARLNAEIGQGSIEAGSGAFDENGDINEYGLILQGAVGIGFNLEIEATLPFTFVEELDVSSGGVEFTNTSKGVGDLVLGLNWAALRDSKDTVQLIGGLFVVLPTGDDTRAVPEIVSPLGNSPGEDGGMGTGAMQYGFQIGISKRLSVLEPYALFRYRIGGTGDDGDFETDFPDVGTLLFGTEIHLGEALTLDARAFVEFIGEEVRTDDTGADATTEAYKRYGLEGRVYLSLGPQVTLTAGLGAYANSDHAFVEESNLEITGVWVITAEIGLQISFGK